ncbi:MAG: MFS transporter [Myxococcales bacterium]|nr:MFS transporter [Myxococcales bacterium]
MTAPSAPRLAPASPPHPPAFAATALTLGLAAASTGTAIPSLKPLAAHMPSFAGPSGFVVAHVAGGILAAWVLRRDQGHLFRNDRRGLVRVALAGSLLLNLAMTQASSGATLVGLRLLEGICHVAAVSALMASVHGAAALRRKHTAGLGAVLVLGVAAGLGLGGVFVHDGSPTRCFSLAAGLAAVALLTSMKVPSARGQGLTPAPSGFPSGASWAPALVVAAERLAMGLLTVLVPLSAPSPRQAASLLGSLMLTSVAGIPLARRLADRLGAARVVQLGVVILSSALLASGLLHPFFGSGAVVWAVAVGLGAAAVFSGALMQVSEGSEAERLRGMGLVHAFGALGFLMGSSLAGVAAAVTTEATALEGLLALGAPVMWAASLASRRLDRPAPAAA